MTFQTVDRRPEIERKECKQDFLWKEDIIAFFVNNNQEEYLKAWLRISDSVKYEVTWKLSNFMCLNLCQISMMIPVLK